MRTLKRNKVKLYYSLFDGKEEIKDANDNYIGEKPVYQEPLEMMCNISPAKGEMATRLFGESLLYDKVLVFQKANSPAIDEFTIFWIDNLDTEKPHDYIAKAVGRSLNSVAVAVKKVTVNA